jgi:hypothetical protein
MIGLMAEFDPAKARAIWACIARPVLPGLQYVRTGLKDLERPYSGSSPGPRDFQDGYRPWL